MGCCKSICKSLEPACNALGCSCSEGEYEGARGIVKDKRHCTDIPFLTAYILGLAGLIYIWSWALNEGDIDKLMLPNDYLGNICGKGDLDDKPVGVWPDPNTYTFKICAENCDATMDNYKMWDKEMWDNGMFVTDVRVPVESTDTKKYCLPASQNPSGWDDASSQNRRQMEDLYEVMPIIGASAAIAILMGFLFIMLMRRCLKTIVWFGITLVILGGFLLAYYLFIGAQELEDENSQTLQYIVAGLVCFFTVLFLLIIICLRNRIAIAIEVIKSAGRALTDIPLLVMTPFAAQVVAVTFIIVWVLASAYMFSLSETYEEDTPENIWKITEATNTVNSYGLNYPEKYERMDYDSAISNSFWFHFFMLLWTLQVCTYFLYTFVAGAVADWYFTRREGDDGPKVRGDGEDELSNTPIWDAFKRTLWNFGSVCFGAFLIAVIQFIRWVLRYLERQMRNQGRCLQYCVCVLDCCLGCIESCIDCISKRALIITAITGKPLCSSFAITFNIVWVNMCRVSVMIMFTSIVIFVGKVCVCLATTGISVMIITYAYPDVDSIVLPAVMIMIMSFVIASTFMTVYETAVDTVFLSFLLDEEWNAKKAEEKMFADKPILDIIGKYEDLSKSVAEKEMGIRSKDGNDYEAAVPKDKDVAAAKDKDPVGVKA